MSTELTNYNPQHVVELKDGTQFYIESKSFDSFYKDLNSQKFVRIGDVVINSFEVAKVYQDDKKTADVLKQFSKDVRLKACNRIKEFRANLNKEPSQSTILKWANDFNQK